MVLCGDPRQLGPAVRSGDCQAHGLATSLLEGWTTQYGPEADSWQQQGRAPPMCEPVLPKHAGCSQCCTKQNSIWPRDRSDRAQQQGRGPPDCEPGLRGQPRLPVTILQEVAAGCSEPFMQGSRAGCCMSASLVESSVLAGSVVECSIVACPQADRLSLAA